MPSEKQPSPKLLIQIADQLESALIEAGEAILARYRLPEPAGAWVLGVVHALPAASAGIPPGVVIVALDRQPVRSPEDLTRLVAGGPVGRAVRIEYVLPGGVERHAEVELKPLAAPLQQALMAR